MRGLGGEGIWCDFDGVVVSMLASIVAGSLHESEAGVYLQVCEETHQFCPGQLCYISSHFHLGVP